MKNHWSCFGLLILVLVAPQALSARETGGVLTLALSSIEMTLDPLRAYRTDELQTATGIHEGLVSYNPRNLRPVPGVAFKWEVTEDGRTYTFYLRERAKFSNGERVTAEDFRQSWLRIINPEAEGEYSFLLDVIKGAADYRSGRNPNPESVGVRAISPTILEVELENPAGHFLSMLPHMSFSPIHSSYRDTTGWEDRAPLVSNGPFTLVSRSAGEMVFDRNTHYWDRWNVALDGIKIIAEPDPAQKARLLNEGTVHWADYAQIGLLENDDLVQVAALFATSYLYFRTDLEPWSDPLVRKGISLLIPWNELRAAASSFAGSTLVPAVGFYDKPPGLEERNVETALQLLAQAGYPMGRGLPDIKAIVTPGSVAETVLQAAAKIWKERIGVKTEIVPVSFSAYQEIARRGGYVIGASTWIGDFADPLSFLQMWTTESKLNDAKYASEPYDSLIRAALSERSEARYDFYARAETLLLSDDVVVIPLANPPSLNLIDLDRIGGWYVNALDIHPFKSIRFKTPRVPEWYVSLPQGKAAPPYAETDL